MKSNEPLWKKIIGNQINKIDIELMVHGNATQEINGVIVDNSLYKSALEQGIRNNNPPNYQIPQLSEDQKDKMFYFKYKPILEADLN